MRLAWQTASLFNTVKVILPRGSVPKVKLRVLRCHIIFDVSATDRPTAKLAT